MKKKKNKNIIEKLIVFTSKLGNFWEENKRIMDSSKLWTMIYIYTDYKDIPGWEQIEACERKKSVLQTWQCWGHSKKNYTVLLFNGEQPEKKEFQNHEEQLIGIGTVSVHTADDKYKRSVWIHHIEIYNEYKRKGYGKLLLSGLEKLAADDIAKSPKKNYYAEIVCDEIPFYLATGYDEIFEKPNQVNWKIRSRSDKRIYAKSLDKEYDQEVRYFTPQDDVCIFEHACEDGRKDAVKFLPFIDSFIEDEERKYDIFVRLFKFNVDDFSLIYRHLMRATYETELESMDELLKNNHLVRVSELCEFFECKVTEYTDEMSDELRDFLKKYTILDL